MLPKSHADLLTRTLFAHVGTSRPDGQPQVNPMWFEWDGQNIRLTCSTPRMKYRNVQRDPRITISVSDPDNPYRYVEVRGVVKAIEPDPDGAFFDRLAARYGLHLDDLPDRRQRVVLVVEPTGSSYQ